MQSDDSWSLPGFSVSVVSTRCPYLSWCLHIVHTTDAPDSQPDCQTRRMIPRALGHVSTMAARLIRTLMLLFAPIDPTGGLARRPGFRHEPRGGWIRPMGRPAGYPPILHQQVYTGVSLGLVHHYLDVRMLPNPRNPSARLGIRCCRSTCTSLPLTPQVRGWMTGVGGWPAGQAKSSLAESDRICALFRCLLACKFRGRL
jgi:hypothetical protein